MHIKFEEMGLVVGGVEFGLFTGEAQFDELGEVVVIEIERTDFRGKALLLDISDLVNERIAFRRKHGSAFSDATDGAVQVHVRKWNLFQGLSDAIRVRYKDDVADYLADLRSEGGREVA
jgi:hypothetical protein